jgi:hypothetical protein
MDKERVSKLLQECTGLECFTCANNEVIYARMKSDSFMVIPIAVMLLGTNDFRVFTEDLEMAMKPFILEEE